MILFERHFGEGEVIIILHGLFGQSDNWTGIARNLGDQFSVFTFDLRNHGQSGHSDAFNYEFMADDVVETMNHLGLKKVHLIGHSMGGKVAMRIAQKFPDRLYSLLIADIGPRYYKPHHEEILQGLNSIHPEKITTRKEAEEILTESIKDEGTKQFLLKNLYRTPENKFAWRFNLNVLTDKIENVGEALPAGICFVPTLFYHGGNSRYIMKEEYSEIRKQFPNTTFLIMENAGHWLHAEKPAEFIDTVKGWILSNY